MNNINNYRVYARSTNGKKIIILDADLESLRSRQRCKLMNGLKVKPMRFASFKETMKYVKRNQAKVVGPFNYNFRSKL